MIQRNTPQSIYFLALASGDPQTGNAANLTASVFKDGVRAAATNAPVEEDATFAPGVYRLDLTAAETNADTVLAWITSSSNGVDLTPIGVGGMTHAPAMEVLGPFTATGTPTVSTVTCAVDTSDSTLTNYAPPEANRLAGMYLIVASGDQKGQLRAIVSSAVSGGTMTLVVDALPEAIAAGDTFRIGGLA